MKKSNTEKTLSAAIVPDSENNSTVSFELLDGEKVNQKYPETFWIPSRLERENLLPDINVKLMFEIHDGDIECTENMWVIVEKKLSGYYEGILNSQPCCTTKLCPGTKVKFGPEHVINIWEPDECDENQLKAMGLSAPYVQVLPWNENYKWSGLLDRIRATAKPQLINVYLV